MTRFPASIKKDITEHLWNMAAMTSGVRLRFTTRCDVIGLDCTRVSKSTHGRLGPMVESGFDLYADGEFAMSIGTSGAGGPYMGFFNVDGSKAHEYEIYFPYHAEVDLETLFCEFKRGNDDPVIEPASKFALPAPVVYYGSSITHGSDAQRVGLTYPAIVSRALNLDFINLGFGGAGKGEPVVARLLASIPNVSLYVLDWGINLCAPEEVHLIHERYQALLDEITARKPGVPVLIVNIQQAGPPWDATMAQNIDTIRAEVLRCYEREKAAGRGNVYYVDARDFIGPGDMDLTVDRVHPNQAGFFQYARSLAPVISRILDVPRR